MLQKLFYDKEMIHNNSELLFIFFNSNFDNRRYKLTKTKKN